jgi:aspartyl/glutamyl-tRNA(Asn/Gln) amidotransferase C subunit
LSINREQVLRVAELARLHLGGEAEVEAMARSLNAILDYVELLKRADTTEAPAMAHVMPPWDAMRDDEPGMTLEPEEWQESVPCRTGPFPMVPRFVEE